MHIQFIYWCLFADYRLFLLLLLLMCLTVIVSPPYCIICSCLKMFYRHKFVTVWILHYCSTLCVFKRMHIVCVSVRGCSRCLGRETSLEMMRSFHCVLFECTVLLSVYLYTQRKFTFLQWFKVEVVVLVLHLITSIMLQLYTSASQQLKVRYCTVTAAHLL